ncbi:hypothetical protein SEMRO_499_G155130.1 [Seminavis robusta]|uniref:Uncharacterized protein n=1 Tax=Seminavis robusta TaxID=568900 RepID=A0A9N8HE67_9STRA|nr:hypothetical protein SEMRO_499_G155130.1 [Seminavis robusta]|eukprot:Sro499_g155130.1 n/a (173) ;mRNA; r:44561-45079
MTTNDQPIKMAMSIDGAKSIKIEEDDTIVFTMNEGPPVELKFVMPFVHKKEGQDEGYATPMAKPGSSDPSGKRAAKVGFLSPESTKSNKSNKSDVHMASPPFASPSICESSMGSPSPFKGSSVINAYDQGFSQETAYLSASELCLDYEEEEVEKLSETLAKLGSPGSTPYYD